MKVLFVTDHFYPEPSAPAAHIYDRVLSWAGAGHDVTVLTAVPNFPDGVPQPGYRNRWRSEEEVAGVRIVRVKTYMAPNRGRLRRILDYVSFFLSASLFAWTVRRPDVIVSSSPHIFVPMAAVLHAGLRRVPHVLEVRDLWPAAIVATGAMRPGLWLRALQVVERILYRSSRRIVCLTATLGAAVAERGARPDRVVVTYSGANLEIFRPRPAEPGLAEALRLDGRFVVGYLGTIGMAHDLENAVAAIQRLDDGVGLVFVGDGAARPDLERMAAGTSRIVFVGAVPRERVPQYWSVCDVALVHLRDDPLFRSAVPSKIFEAMAMGVPVVCVSPGGEGAELVARLGIGVNVAAGDPERLASAIEELRNDPARRERYREAALRHREEFSRARMAEVTLRALEEAAR